MARKSTKPGRQRVGNSESGSKVGERGGQMEMQSREKWSAVDKAIERRSRGRRYPPPALPGLNGIANLSGTPRRRGLSLKARLS